MALMTMDQWEADVAGKYIDRDGYPVNAPNQCHDVWLDLLNRVLGAAVSLGWAPGAGWTDEVWKQFPAKAGLQNYVVKIVGTSDIRRGDVVFWAYGSKFAPYSHVAIALQAPVNGAVLCMSQNPGPATRSNLGLTGALGVLRPIASVGGSTSSSSTTQTISQEDDEDMLTMYGNKADGMVIACSMATGYWWHIPNMDYLNLMKARGLVKNQDPIYLESNEFGFLKQLLGWASDSLNRGGGTATIDLGAIKTTVTESLSALNVNVDALATAIAAKINAGVAIDDVTTKAEILAAIEANYPEEKK